MRRSSLLLVAGVLAIVLTSCKSGLDGTTGATKKKTTKLPNRREFDSYKVIEAVPGTDKIVVKYNDHLIRLQYELRSGNDLSSQKEII